MPIKISTGSLRKIAIILFGLVTINFVVMLPTKAAGTVEWSTSGQRVTTGVSANTDQTGQQLVRTSEGDYIIVWVDSRNTGDYTGTAEEGTLDTDIYAQKIDDEGTIQWAANGEALETSTRGSLISNSNLTIIADNAGGAFVGWINDNNQTAQTRLHVLHLESDGDIDWTSDVDNATAANTSISMFADATTGVFIAWPNLTPTSDIFVTHLNNLGNIASNWTPGASVNINSSVTHNEYDPQLVTDGAGGVIISYQYVSNTNQYQLYYKKVSATGTAGSAITIAASALNEATPKSITDGNGGIITVFQVSDPADATSKNIYAQRINSADTAIWGANGTAICNATGNQTNPVLTTDNSTPSTGAIFAWEDNRSGTMEIYSQKINTAGTVQWAANGLAVSDTSDGIEQNSPAIVSNNGSGALLTFISNPNDDVDTRIYAQHLASSGSAHWTAGGVLVDDIQAPTERTDTAHVLISDGNAGAIIAFSGIDNATPENGYKLFAQHITDSFGAICSEIGSASFCGRQVITSAILSFYDIPDSFSFDATTVSGQAQAVFSNAEPVNPTGAEDLEDLLVVQDTRESGGFQVQLSAEGDFSDGINTIPIENLYVVTNTSANLANTISAGGVTYENTISDVNVQTINTPIDAGDNNADVNNATTFTSLIPESQFASNSAIVLMDGTLSSSLGRNGKMYQFLNFYLNIPAFQPSGDYAAILTYTLFDDTTP